jgi:hypothetical protein
MSYFNIDNLYKNQDILKFKECYAMEKVHGTSAHITFKSGRLSFFSGGSSHEEFIKNFDQNLLTQMFSTMALEDTSITIYGEACGGRLQGMSHTYGDKLMFIAFEVKIGDKWLNVPTAEKIVFNLGLEFMPYKLISTKLEDIDRERDAPSEVAIRRGCGNNVGRNGITPPIREGVVLRPLEEYTKNNGERIIAKHKRDEFMETNTPRKVISPDQMKSLEDAKAIANEWVVPERLNHILTSGVIEAKIENTGKIIQLMIEDVLKESKGEIIDSPGARKEIGRLTALMFKESLKGSLNQ